jgi:hypothetical protein
MIAFYSVETDELIGTVSEVKGRLVASSGILKGVEVLDPEAFYSEFSSWSNGSLVTARIPDDEEAPTKFEWDEEGLIWTSEDLHKAGDDYLDH